MVLLSSQGRDMKEICSIVYRSENTVSTWLDDSPRDEGYQQSNWTLKLINHHMLQEFGQRFSLSHIWEMVHGQGFTLIRPSHKTIVPTQEEIAETNKKTFYYLEKARLGEVRLFYLNAIRAFFRSVVNQPKKVVSLLRLNLNSFP